MRFSALLAWSSTRSFPPKPDGRSTSPSVRRPFPAADVLEALSARNRSSWKRGLPSGDKTGWPIRSIKHYTVAPGQFTVVTGWPSSGKSEWLDALLVNLSRQGWKFAMFSPENQPVELHIAKILEKLRRQALRRRPDRAPDAR
jgi:twinkle protein